MTNPHGLIHTCYLETIDQNLSFDAGSAIFTVGKVCTGTTSHATGTIKSVTLLTGAWSGTAAGYLVLTGVSGTFQNNETLSDNGTIPGHATADGANADYMNSYGRKVQTASTTATPCRFINMKTPPGKTDNSWSGRFPAIILPAGIALTIPPPAQRLAATETGFTGTFEIQYPPIFNPDVGTSAIHHITCALKAVS